MLKNAVLRNILEKADEAIADGRIAADIRFGHDSGLLPLMTLIGTEGFDRQLPPASAWDEGWHNSDRIPMASNLQMVFFKDAKGRVLVKFYYNERETSLPAWITSTLLEK